MAYNLLDEKWIPVLYLDGTYDRVGIRKALEDAGRIRQIAASNPMDRVAILRFLLAILYWCKGSPRDDQEVSGFDNAPPPDWFSKLCEMRDCFNLLGNGERFYQYRGARRTRSVTDLLQEIPTGNNFWHFRHSTDNIDGLCAACCAFGLLRLPLFSVSGLPNLLAGINGVPPVYVVPWGLSLWDTLCANWRSCQEVGVPTWENVDFREFGGVGVPLLTGLTLLSRHVWLHEPCGPPRRCIACGNTESSLIQTCEFESAGRQETNLWNDPHVVYSDKIPRRSAKATDETAAGKFKMDRAWADLLARILAGPRKFARAGRPTMLSIVGFATSNAKNVDVWERTVTIPPLESIPTTAVSALEQWDKEGRRIERQTTRSELGRAVVAAVRPHIEARVSAKVGELLADGEHAWEKAAAEYREIMSAVARSLEPGITTAAFARRQQIARLAPAMAQKAESAKRPRSAKGGTE